MMMKAFRQVFRRGMVFMWSGLLTSIPGGFLLCNGENGTPDLRDKFMKGANSDGDFGDFGGSVSHTHPFTAYPHYHDLPVGVGFLFTEGMGMKDYTDPANVSGITDSTDGQPPWYKLFYIMKR